MSVFDPFRTSACLACMVYFSTLLSLSSLIRGLLPPISSIADATAEIRSRSEKGLLSTRCVGRRRATPASCPVMNTTGIGELWPMAWIASMPHPASSRTSDVIKSGRRRAAAPIALWAVPATSNELNPHSRNTSSIANAIITSSSIINACMERLSLGRKDNVAPAPLPEIRTTIQDNDRL